MSTPAGTRESSIYAVVVTAGDVLRVAGENHVVVSRCRVENGPNYRIEFADDTPDLVLGASQRVTLIKE